MEDIDDWSKLKLVEAIAELHGGPVPTLGRGSKEYKSLFDNIAVDLGVEVVPGKPAMLERLLTHLGAEFDGESMTSTGHTIEMTGLRALYTALRAHLAGGVTPPTGPPTRAVLEELAERTTTYRETRIRDPKFRGAILDTWGERCIACGERLVQLLEAAHVLAARHADADVASNGVPLCRTHHRLLDLEYYEFAMSGDVLVIRDVPAQEALLKAHGHSIGTVEVAVPDGVDAAEVAQWVELANRERAASQSRK